jgi:pimeloyl-ACP methyl ester carboxylesterase
VGLASARPSTSHSLLPVTRRRGYAVAASDGTPVYYSVHEPPANGAVQATSGGWPPVVLCDGIGCDGYVWRHLRPELAGRTPVVHPHYRGHGRTPLPRDPARVTIADLADDLACVLDDAGVGEAVLCGHSMGVQVALEAHARHPSRVRGLVLVCGAPSHPLATFHGSNRLERLVPRVARLVERAPWLANGLSRTLLPTRLAFAIAAKVEIDGTLIELADFMPYLEGLSRVDARLFLAMLQAAGSHSAEAHLPDIDVPVLVVAGARDGFTPPERSRQMAEAIPGSEYLEIPRGSHTAPLERPELFCSSVVHFLDRRFAAVRR